LRQLETSGDGLSAGNLPNREGVKGLLETRFYKELNELEASVYAELAKASLPYPFSAAVHQPPHGQLDKAKSKGKLPQTEGNNEFFMINKTKSLNNYGFLAHSFKTFLK
jgi:hypothetical protein